MWQKLLFVSEDFSTVLSPQQPAHINYYQLEMWSNIAVASGLEDATELRDTMALIMTSDQIVEAQLHARDCMARGLKGC